MRLVEQLRKQEERLHTVYGAPPSGAGAALVNPMVQLQGQLPSLFGEMKQEVRAKLLRDGELRNTTGNG